MLFVNGKQITDEDLEKFNKLLEQGVEVVTKILRSDKGNVLVYTKEYLELD